VFLALAGTGNAGVFAAGLDVNFDFARVAEYREATPPERAAQYPSERLITVKLPISVRFQGLAQGEVEHLDIEIDGSLAGLRVASFSPTTQLAAEAVAVETITKTTRDRSLGATLGAAIPVPIGAVGAELKPAVSAGMASGKQATEKVKRIPPKRPVVVSGTFGEGRAVFFKFKQSSQTSFEGVHELEITFVAPADWRGGGVRITCTARGHRPVLWMDQPTVFGQVDDVIELYPEGNVKLRDAAARRAEAATTSEDSSTWELGNLFVRGS
jgi:hypothetical protein